MKAICSPLCCILTTLVSKLLRALRALSPRAPRSGFKSIMEKVVITEKLSQFSDHWNPRIVGELNGQHVKAVKLLGEFVWHHHDEEDELFLVIKGQLAMEFRDKTVTVNPGEFIIVPRKVEHRPVAKEEVHILLFEPAGTLNTGNVENERTKKNLQRI